MSKKFEELFKAMDMLEEIEKGLKEGDTISDISELTDLTEDEIKILHHRMSWFNK